MALRAVVALDSFKGSVTSAQANAAVARGIASVMPDAVVTQVPVADGGEGTLGALASVGEVGVVSAADLLGRPIDAPFVSLGDSVVLESASTVGLHLLGLPSLAFARRVHSFGLGAQLRAVVERERPVRVLVGLGGTGCTDGGVGFLLALGARIWLADGSELWPEGAPRDENPLLRRPVRVELPEVDMELVGLADVSSPLLGPAGAARMFGPQKGADVSLVAALEDAMEGWAGALVSAGADVADTPGAGAAGGIGVAILALSGQVEPGLVRILTETSAAPAFSNADLVITGEGSLDAQTAQGKAPAAIARFVRALTDDGAHRPQIVALAGRVDADPSTLRAIGLDAAFAIHPRGLAVERAMERERTLRALERAARRAVQAFEP